MKLLRALKVSIFDLSVILLLSLQLSNCSPQFGGGHAHGFGHGHTRNQNRQHNSHEPQVYPNSGPPLMYTDSELPRSYPDSGPPRNYPDYEARKKYSEPRRNYPDSEPSRNYPNTEPSKNYPDSESPQNYANSESPRNYPNSGPIPNYPASEDFPNYPNSGPPIKQNSNTKATDQEPTLNIFPGKVPSERENVGINLYPSQGERELSQKEPQENSCPEGSGIYKKTGLCYKFVSRSLGAGELSPCGQFMDFYQSSSDKRYGECDCKDSYLGISRPIVYHRQTDQCYWLFDQGPCSSEDLWLVLSDNDIPECQSRTCPANSPEDWSPNPTDNKRKYWFRHRGKCYKSDAKGFCENEDHNIYLTYKEEKFVTECKPQDINLKTLLNGAKPLPCLPGHKESATGECRRTASFE